MISPVRIRACASFYIHKHTHVVNYSTSVVARSPLMSAIHTHIDINRASHDLTKEGHLQMPTLLARQNVLASVLSEPTSLSFFFLNMYDIVRERTRDWWASKRQTQLKDLKYQSGLFLWDTVECWDRTATISIHPQYRTDQ